MSNNSLTACVVADVKLDNLGDKLIFDCLAKELVEQRYSLIFKPSNHNCTQGGVRYFYYWNLFAAIRSVWRADTIIFGGGGILQDNSNTINLFYYALYSLIALLMRRKKVIRSVGVTPIATSLGRILVRIICYSASEISVRDEGSRHNLGLLIAPEKITIEKDIALTYEPDYEAIRNIIVDAAKPPFVLISLRPLLLKRSGISDKQFKEEFANCLNKICEEQSATPVFVALHREKDVLYIDNFIEESGIKNAVHIKYPTADELCFLLKHSQLALCMRLHAAILAYRVHANFIALSYSEKIDNFMASEGLEDLCIKVKDVNFLYGKLTPFLNHLQKEKQ